ncbi:MAG: ferritin family protein [Planctomycetota bacterium]|jgi:rubrerythrin
MAIVTISQVLGCAEDFERMLAEFYAKVAQQSTREGVRLLADYMSRHRQRTHEALSKMSAKDMSRICKTPLRYEPHAADCRCFEGVELSPDAPASEVLDTAVKFDECLVRLYRQVVRQPIDQEVKELFENLIRWEQDDEIQLKKIKAMDYF